MKKPLSPSLLKRTATGLLTPALALIWASAHAQQPVNPFATLLNQAGQQQPVPQQPPSQARQQAPQQTSQQVQQPQPAAAAQAAPSAPQPAAAPPTQPMPAPVQPSPAPSQPVLGAPPQAPASVPALAQPASRPASASPAVELSNTPNPGVTLKFDNADLYDVIQVILGEILKLDYIIDPSVQGRITLKSTGAISMADIFSTLETALATSNISIVRQGKLYKVVRDANASRDAVGKDGVGPASVVMQIIPLKFVQASQMVNTLRNFVGPQAAITNDPANRHLIVVDRAANVEKIIDMARTLDTDYFSQVNIRLVPLQYGEAAELAKELDALFKTSGLFNWTGTDAAKAFFLPVTRMNALLVATSNDRVMQAAEQWIRTLDAEPKDGLGAYVHVYPVVNSNAAHLANLITQIFGGAAAPAQNNQGAAGLPSANSSAFAGSAGGAGGSTGAAGASGLGGAAGGSGLQAAGASRTIERGNVPSQAGQQGAGRGLAGSVQVIADEVTNTLVVRASAQDYQQIRKVLERLDSSPRQVLVQVMVAEVALNDTLQYGVEWWLKSALSHGGKSWPGFIGMDGAIKPNISASATDSTAGAVLGTTPAVTGAGSGLNYAVFGSAGQVIGMLNLLGQDTDVNVLSTPHVLASDGKVAKVEVGNEVPVITQTLSTPTATSGLTTGSGFSTSNSVQYRPTGILLEVKPSITASGQVTLSISQEVSNVGNNIAAGGTEYPSFQKRKVTTDATVENGRTIMLAGLIEDRNNDSVTGVPGLKDVPVFGALFGTTRKVRNKTELLITITPYIVSSREESERLAETFQGSLRQLQGLLQKNSPPDLREEAGFTPPPPAPARPRPAPPQPSYQQPYKDMLPQ
ncbi:type II secretion system secretin GspD [Melaminivora jejuensis]|uniref:type II secretion system secretin GspD n=1 Tax=Melaminivora jejuensis TaxID=1267217 RepID=UPI001AE01F40|nr:type II secretion system secretin GspD [Melaminivora jejuensis]UHJ64542.1 type II secretion system secretin GspD [Melaminivora jejuensis]